MSSARSRSTQVLEEKMQGLDQSSLRYHALESSKNFKTSWVELGRVLYTVYKDKLYKEWGFGNFDIYTSREIGIRKQTALKLLRSYFFLEKEEPLYLKDGYAETQDAASVPSFESIDLLRLAKNKKLDQDDYHQLKEEVFTKGKDARQLKRDLTSIIRQREELDPEEARQKKKAATVRRFLSTLKSLKQELQTSKMLPAVLLRETESLIKKLEDQL